MLSSPETVSARIGILESNEVSSESAAEKRLATRGSLFLTVLVDPYFFIAAPAGLPADTKAALAEALHNAINSEAARKAIVNALKTDPSDLGPDGTQNMLVEGVGNVKKLFGK